ncbi:MAG: DUF1080 domain-containing protein [Gemmatimonadaceae bacterium]
MKRLLPSCLLLLSAVSIAGAQPNQLTSAEKTAGWRMLFDGKTFAGWRGLGYDSVPSAHWRIKDGTIMKIASGNVPKIADGQPASGGDLMSIDTYENFELSWEFKLTPKANTGVKYNVSEEFSLKNAGNHAALGWEFQLQDDINGDDITSPTHLTGSLYEMIASNAPKITKSVGEWNSARLVFNGNKGEHWLNGRKVVEFDITTPEFAAQFAKSKYHNIKGFEERRKGHVILQDHNDEVYFRSIKIRELH